MRNPTLKYCAGYKYQVYEVYQIQLEIYGFNVKHKFFELTEDGLLTIFVGYAWDGASGLTWDTPSSIIGSLVHDVLFQAMRLGLLQHDPCFTLANRELRRLCVNDGMYRWRAQMWYDFVTTLGSAYAAVQPDKVLTAGRITNVP